MSRGTPFQILVVPTLLLPLLLPLLQSLLQAHDSIAEKEMEPEPLPTQGETLTQWGGETVKIIRIEKAKDIPLVTAARSNRGETGILNHVAPASLTSALLCGLCSAGGDGSQRNGQRGDQPHRPRRSGREERLVVGGR